MRDRRLQHRFPPSLGSGRRCSFSSVNGEVAEGHNGVHTVASPVHHLHDTLVISSSPRSQRQRQRSHHRPSPLRHRLHHLTTAGGQSSRSVFLPARPASLAPFPPALACLELPSYKPPLLAHPPQLIRRLHLRFALLTPLSPLRFAHWRPFATCASRPSRAL